MPQNRQPQPSENDLNPWRITPGEVALGMGIFILVHAIGVGRLVWNEAFLNTEDTWRETFHAITGGMAETALAGAGLAVFAIVGTKTVRLTAGRTFGPGSTLRGLCNLHSARPVGKTPPQSRIKGGRAESQGQKAEVAPLRIQGAGRISQPAEHTPSAPVRRRTNSQAVRANGDTASMGRDPNDGAVALIGSQRHVGIIRTRTIPAAPA